MIYSLLSGFLLLASGSMVSASQGYPNNGEVVPAVEVKSVKNPAQVTTFFIPIDSKTKSKAQTDFGITAGDIADAIEGVEADSDTGKVQIEQILLGASSGQDSVLIYDEVSGEIVDCENTLVVSESILNISPYYYQADPVVVQECKKAKANTDVVVFGAEAATSIVDVKQFIRTDGIEPVVRSSLFLNTKSKLLATSTATLKNKAQNKGKLSVETTSVASGDIAETGQDIKTEITSGGVSVSGTTVARASTRKVSKDPIAVIQEYIPAPQLVTDKNKVKSAQKPSLTSVTKPRKSKTRKARRGKKTKRRSALNRIKKIKNKFKRSKRRYML